MIKILTGDDDHTVKCDRKRCAIKYFHPSMFRQPGYDIWWVDGVGKGIVTTFDQALESFQNESSPLLVVATQKVILLELLKVHNFEEHKHVIFDVIE